MSDAWEQLYAERDAARLRVAVLEKAVEEANAAKHAANNKCQAVVGVCEEAIRELRGTRYTRQTIASLLAKTLEVALETNNIEDPAARECAAIVRKIRQDAKIAGALSRFSGDTRAQEILDGLADELERGVREQADDG